MVGDSPRSLVACFYFVWRRRRSFFSSTATLSVERDICNGSHKQTTTFWIFLCPSVCHYLSLFQSRENSSTRLYLLGQFRNWPINNTRQSVVILAWPASSGNPKTCVSLISMIFVPLRSWTTAPLQPCVLLSSAEDLQGFPSSW